MKLELYFTDRDGRRWTVWDWKVFHVAKKRCRVWPGMETAEWRTFVAADSAERRHYRFKPGEGHACVPELLAHQLQQAKLEVHAGPAAAASEPSAAC